MIDGKNFSILKVLEESDKPAYKSDIHRKLKREINRIPIDKCFSVQTVCRRIEELEESGYVEPTIIKSEKTNRVFIKGYKVTSEGGKQIDEFRERFLLRTASDYINAQINPERDKPEIEEEFIKELVCNIFDIQLEEDLEDVESVLAAVFLYYSQRRIREKVDKPVFQEFADRISGQNPELAESLRAHISQPPV